MASIVDKILFEAIGQDKLAQVINTIPNTNGIVNYEDLALFRSVIGFTTPNGRKVRKVYDELQKQGNKGNVTNVDINMLSAINKEIGLDMLTRESNELPIVVQMAGQVKALYSSDATVIRAYLEGKKKIRAVLFREKDVIPEKYI